MTDYRSMTDFHRARVDREVKENIAPEDRINDANGFTWHEPEWTLDHIHKGDYCAECWQIYYNCTCSHE